MHKDQCLKIAQDWLSHFEKVLQSGKSNDLEDCFHSESHWRDLLAFTGTISPYGGAKEISLGLNSFQKIAQAHSFRIIDKHAQPRLVNRLGRPVIEAIFAFETKLGRGEGVVRVPENSQKTAWTFLTTLSELRGFPEKVGLNRPSGEAYSRNFGGSNWLDPVSYTHLTLPTIAKV